MGIPQRIVVGMGLGLEKVEEGGHGQEYSAGMGQWRVLELEDGSEGGYSAGTEWLRGWEAAGV